MAQQQTIDEGGPGYAQCQAGDYSPITECYYCSNPLQFICRNDSTYNGHTKYWYWGSCQYHINNSNWEKYVIFDLLKPNTIEIVGKVKW